MSRHLAMNITKDTSWTINNSCSPATCMLSILLLLPLLLNQHTYTAVTPAAIPAWLPSCLWVLTIAGVLTLTVPYTSGTRSSTSACGGINSSNMCGYKSTKKGEEQQQQQQHRCRMLNKPKRVSRSVTARSTMVARTVWMAALLRTATGTSAMDTALCGLVAATSIGAVHSEWSCSTAGIPSTSPCASGAVWPGLVCSGGNVVKIDLVSKSLTGKMNCLI